MSRSSKARPSFDMTRVTRQFQGLNGRHPGLWPVLPRVAVFSLLFVSLLAVGWGLYWRGLFDELEAGRNEEQQLKAQYTDKIRQAVNLPVLRKQKEQVSQYVSQLEKQLPSKAEMDALLSDIKDYYADLPITVRVVGNYHDLGAFASDLANLPRIVTLHNVSIQQQDKTALLSMDATARTFRYLDAEEIAQARAAAAKKKAAEGAAKK
jgi:type IV pilus assembly protein PilO